MPIYYRPSDSGGSKSPFGGANSGDAAEGGQQIVDNMITSSDMGGTDSVANILADSAAKGAAPSLPKLELSGASLESLGMDSAAPGMADSLKQGLDAGGLMDIPGLGDSLQHMFDFAGMMADPLSIMGMIVDFFAALFATMANSLMSAVMDNINAYNEAAQAALDAIKKPGQL
jgi:hypothetical protein